MASLLVPLTFGGFAGCWGRGGDFFNGRPPLQRMPTPVSWPYSTMVEPLGALTGYTVEACTRCGSSYLQDITSAAV
ncbi:hypothetical protein IG631_01563 [Alternaria alternata]|nr:hypothetical protein IG631_01563 [Alternaria alternata]